MTGLDPSGIEVFRDKTHENLFILKDKLQKGWGNIGYTLLAKSESEKDHKVKFIPIGDARESVIEDDIVKADLWANIYSVFEDNQFTPKSSISITEIFYKVSGKRYVRRLEPIAGDSLAKILSSTEESDQNFLPFIDFKELTLFLLNYLFKAISSKSTIFHGSIHPHNILLEKKQDRLIYYLDDPASWLWKTSDLGLAKDTPKERFLAPEILADELTPENYSLAGDAYAIGRTLQYAALHKNDPENTEGEEVYSFFDSSVYDLINELIHPDTDVRWNAIYEVEDWIYKIKKCEGQLKQVLQTIEVEEQQDYKPKIDVSSSGVEDSVFDEELTFDDGFIPHPDFPSSVFQKGGPTVRLNPEEDFEYQVKLKRTIQKATSTCKTNLVVSLKNKKDNEVLSENKIELLPIPRFREPINLVAEYIRDYEGRASYIINFQAEMIASKGKLESYNVRFDESCFEETERERVEDVEISLVDRSNLGKTIRRGSNIGFTIIIPMIRGRLKTSKSVKIDLELKLVDRPQKISLPLIAEIINPPTFVFKDKEALCPVIAGTKKNYQIQIENIGDATIIEKDMDVRGDLAEEITILNERQIRKQHSHSFTLTLKIDLSSFNETISVVNNAIILNTEYRGKPKQCEVLFDVTIKKQEGLKARVAVDIGTSNSVVAYEKGNSYKFLEFNREKSETHLIRSVIQYSREMGREDSTIGNIAYEELSTASIKEQIFLAFKQFIGQPYNFVRSITLRNQAGFITYDEIFEDYVRRLWDAMAGATIGGAIPKRLVMTHPVQFTYRQLMVYRSIAAIISGIAPEKITFVDEASAAAIQAIWEIFDFSNQSKSTRKINKLADKKIYLAVYDFGGGTTDIAILEIVVKKSEDSIPIQKKKQGGFIDRITDNTNKAKIVIEINYLATYGDAKFGGDDITDIVAEQIVEYFNRNARLLDESGNPSKPATFPLVSFRSIGQERKLNSKREEYAFYNFGSLVRFAETIKCRLIDYEVQKQESGGIISEEEYFKDFEPISFESLNDSDGNVINEFNKFDIRYSFDMNAIIKEIIPLDRFEELVKKKGLKKNTDVFLELIEEHCTESDSPIYLVKSGLSSKIPLLRKLIDDEIKKFTNGNEVIPFTHKDPKGCVASGGLRFAKHHYDETSDSGIEFKLQNATGARHIQANLAWVQNVQNGEKVRFTIKRGSQVFKNFDEVNRIIQAGVPEGDMAHNGFRTSINDKYIDICEIPCDEDKIGEIDTEFLFRINLERISPEELIDDFAEIYVVIVADKEIGFRLYAYWVVEEDIKVQFTPLSVQYQYLDGIKLRKTPEYDSPAIFTDYI